MYVSKQLKEFVL